MDKKSFLRGFGMGVLFAAVILGISFSMRTSKGQVISQARKYGMVFKDKDEKLFSTSTPDNNTDGDTSPVPSTSANAPSNDKNATNGNAAPTLKPQQTKTVVTPKPTKKADSKNNSQKKSAEDRKKELEKEKKKMKEEIEKEKKKLTINAGEWSDSVSKKLLSMGIIKSAKDFDSYLNRYGYSSRIVAGTYDVSVEDSYDELARKITGGK